MTGYIRNNDNPDIQRVGEQIYNAINDTDNTNISYGVCSIINNSIKNSFAPSLIGKHFPPVFGSVMDVDTFEKSIKKNNIDEEANTVIEMFENEEQVDGGRKGSIKDSIIDTATSVVSDTIGDGTTQKKKKKCSGKSNSLAIAAKNALENDLQDNSDEVMDDVENTEDINVDQAIDDVEQEEFQNDEDVMNFINKYVN